MQEKEVNRQMLVKIISCVRFLAEQGLSLRGDGDEHNSNFSELLSLCEEDDPAIGAWAKHSGSNYTSPQIQNEILKILTAEVLHGICISLQRSPSITFMMDETTDVSNHEQAVIVMGYVTCEMEVLEEFIGLYQVPATDSNTLTEMVKESLSRCNLPPSKLRGQCYDGTSAMCGTKSGVATKILAKEPRSLYTHCYGHSVNLAACVTIKGTKLMKDAMEITHEITKLIKYSLRRQEIFYAIKASSSDHHGPGLLVLCPTH